MIWVKALGAMLWDGAKNFLASCLILIVVMAVFTPAILLLGALMYFAGEVILWALLFGCIAGLMLLFWQSLKGWKEKLEREAKYELD